MTVPKRGAAAAPPGKCEERGRQRTKGADRKSVHDAVVGAGEATILAPLT